MVTGTRIIVTVYVNCLFCDSVCKDQSVNVVLGNNTFLL